MSLGLDFHENKHLRVLKHDVLKAFSGLSAKDISLSLLEEKLYGIGGVVVKEGKPVPTQNEIIRDLILIILKDKK